MCGEIQQPLVVRCFWHEQQQRLRGGKEEHKRLAVKH